MPSPSGVLAALAHYSTMSYLLWHSYRYVSMLREKGSVFLSVLLSLSFPPLCRLSVIRARAGATPSCTSSCLPLCENGCLLRLSGQASDVLAAHSCWLPRAQNSSNCFKTTEKPRSTLRRPGLLGTFREITAGPPLRPTLRIGPPSWMTQELQDLELSRAPYQGKI